MFIFQPSTSHFFISIFEIFFSQLFYYHSYVLLQKTHTIISSSNPPRQDRNQLGGGPQWPVLLKHHHPKPANCMARVHASDLTAVHLDEVTRKTRTYQTVFFTVLWTNKNKPIYCSQHYVLVVKEGPANLIFEWTWSSASSTDSSQGSSRWKEAIETVYSIWQEIKLLRWYTTKGFKWMVMMNQPLRMSQEVINLPWLRT